jgi:hypothetical protein
VFEIAAVGMVLRVRSESLVPFQRAGLVLSAVLIGAVEDRISESLTLPGHVVAAGSCYLAGSLRRARDIRDSNGRTGGKRRIRVGNERAGSAGDHDPLGGDDGGAGRRDGGRRCLFLGADEE